MKFLYLSLLILPLNVFSDHLVCIQVFPQPPECLHEDKDDNNNLVIGVAVILGGYYLVKGASKPMDELDLANGIILYRKNKFQLSSISLNAINSDDLDKLKFNNIRLNLLSLKYNYEWK